MALFHAASGSCNPWQSSISRGTMGKASKWLKKLFTGKMEKDGNTAAALVTVPVAREKSRWSFHRLTATAKYSNSRNLLEGTASDRANAAEDAAAVKIQTSFRSHLARKALRALKGLVILQALVRGHLVRKRVAAALHSMQVLISVQARTRAQRILTLEGAQNLFSHRQHDERRSSASHDTEENIKIVKTDLEETFTSTTQEQQDLASSCRFSSSSCKHETSKSSLQLASDSSSFISYMASTESSRAKARLWRPDAVEGGRRSSMEGRRNRQRKPVNAKNISAFLVTEFDRSNASCTGFASTKYCS